MPMAQVAIECSIIHLEEVLVTFGYDIKNSPFPPFTKGKIFYVLKSICFLTLQRGTGGELSHSSPDKGRLGGVCLAASDSRSSHCQFGKAQ